MSKGYIDIRLEGNLDDLTAMARVLMYMQEFERMGTCQTIRLVTDGDGSASIRAFLKNDQGEFEPIAMPDDFRQEFRDKVRAGKEFTIWVGE